MPFFIALIIQGKPPVFNGILQKKTPTHPRRPIPAVRYWQFHRFIDSLFAKGANCG
jgi:hypothetical protein